MQKRHMRCACVPLPVIYLFIRVTPFINHILFCIRFIIDIYLIKAQSMS